MVLGNYFFSNTGAAYEIEQSLRFNSGDSAYLDRSVSTNGNTRTFTISLWFKKGKSARRHAFYGAGNTASPSVGGLWFRIDSNENLIAEGGGGTTISVKSSDLFRDHSAWYHLVLAIDTTQSAGADRVKMYVNGRQISSFTRQLSPNQNYQFVVNTNSATQQIGRAEDAGTFTYHVDGHVAEYNLIDGTQAAATDFGETNSDGVWVPKAYSGSYGTNGFYLKFDPTATNGIGHDHSGNGNNWTANNFTTSGTGTDVMSDTPTNNFPTYNPLYVSIGSTSASDGNLNVSAPNDTSTGSTMAIPASGKYYLEFTFSSGTNANGVGIINTTSTGRYSNSLLFSPNNNVYRNGSSIDSATGSWSSGDVIGLAIDAGAQTVRFYRNNSDLFGANQSFSSIDTGVGFYITVQGGGGQTCSGTLNFGQRAFTYTPPSGFVELCTANLPTPDIADGSQHFNTALWTGNGSSQSITCGFQPDFLWTKARNQSYWHRLHDAVRGRLISLYSNATNAEASQANSITSFDSDGFTVGSDGSHNGSGVTYVGWSWLAGNGTSSNTNGSTTSTVSANPTAGFSIVSWSSPSSGSTTVGHSLGVAPALVIAKLRNVNTHWRIWHQGLSGGNYTLFFNTSSQQVQNDAFGSAPTSTVLNIGSDFSGSGRTNIAYCFAEVESYSRIGSYIGNGSSDGPFVYCGFRPAWVMLRAVENAGKWIINDVTRSSYNVTNHALYGEDPRAEESNGYASIDILSNGFKIRSNWSDFNTNGNDFIFAAFAENPFGGDGVSPATAR